MENKKSNKSRKITFLGMSIWRVFAYFIIYSILGFLIETLFGIVTKGVIESRKSFLYGPFCAIYGLGAVIMIGLLQYFKKNNYTLFFGGFLIGSVVEYLVSLFGEMMLHVKWWDYSNMPLNISGRICVYFSFFWGILAIFLMTHINKKVDILLNWLKQKFNIRLLKTVTVLIILFMAFDCIFTGIALRMFYARIEYNDLVDMQNGEKYLLDYEQIQKTPGVQEFINKYLNDEKMLKTFPNLKVTDINGNIVFIKDLFPNIQTYYVKLFTPRQINRNMFNS